MRGTIFHCYVTSCLPMLAEYLLCARIPLEPHTFLGIDNGYLSRVLFFNIKIETQRESSWRHVAFRGKDGYWSSETTYITTLLGLSPNQRYWPLIIGIWIVNYESGRPTLYTKLTPLVGSSLFHPPIYLSVHLPIHPSTHPFTRTIITARIRRSRI